jgi:outer membrane protein TolC
MRVFHGARADLGFGLRSALWRSRALATWCSWLWFGCLLGASYQAQAQDGEVPSMSLPAVLERARQNPPAVLAALATLARVEAEEAHVRGGYLPRASLEAGTGFQYDNRNLTPNRVRLPAGLPPELREQYLRSTQIPRYEASSFNNYATARFDYALVDLARRHSVGAAAQRTRAQRSGFSASQRVTVSAAAELYVRAHAASELLADARISEERRTQQLTAIAALTKAGIRPSVDLQRAEIERLGARYARETREIEEQAAFAALAVAVGFDPTRPVRPEAFDDAALPAPLAPLAATAIATQRRPELRQLEAELEARRADHRAAIGARLPTLGLLGSGNVSHYDILNGTGIQGLAAGASGHLYLRWNAVDPVVWRRARVAAAAADEAQRRLEAAQLQVGAEVVDAAYAVQRTRAQLEQTIQVLAAAQATRVAQNERYRAGAASLLDLLDAEGLEQNARRQRIEAERDHRIARLALLATCGQLDQIDR